MYRLTDEEVEDIGPDVIEAIQMSFESFSEFVDYQRDDLVGQLARQYHLDEDTVRKLEYG